MQQRPVVAENPSPYNSKKKIKKSFTIAQNCDRIVHIIEE